MKHYIIRRLLQSIVVIFIVSLIIFLIMRLLPGDPVLLYVNQDQLKQAISQEQIDTLRHQFGLDKPMIIQYFDWVSGLVRGDLGNSIFRGTTVAYEIGRALPISVYVGFLAFIVAHLFGIPAGIITAVRRGKWQDSLLTSLANIGISAPIFWVGILLIYAFGLHLRLLPIQGFTSPFEDFWLSIRQVIMPVFCLALPHMAGSTRQTRSAMLETIRQDYIRAAWARGLSERTIIVQHALKNGMIPVLTLAGMAIPLIIGGQVLIETVFNIPGMGRLAVDALFTHDYAVVQGVVLVITLFVILCNLTVDLAYGWLDPRVRYR